MKYYIQDSRYYVGNCVLFWAMDRHGYTTDIDKAGLYSEEEAVAICKNRDTDIMWSEPYIKGRVQLTCDSQYLDIKSSGLVNEEEKCRHELIRGAINDYFR
jgi:hypothetical protein